jgi:hypothetical protein
MHISSVSSCVPCIDIGTKLRQHFGHFNLVGIVWQKDWGVGEGLTPHFGTPFHTDSNQLVFVSIALILTEILIDCDLT